MTMQQARSHAATSSVRRYGLDWTDAAASLATLLFGLWDIATPSLWRDEAVTATYAPAGGSSFVELTEYVDSVHAPFYFFQWAWTSIFGTSELMLRLPSAIAIAVAAGLLNCLARRYVDRYTAIMCAVLFVALPPVSRYAQEARATGLVIGLAVATTLVLHFAAEGTRLHLWFGYSALLAAMLSLSVVSAVSLIPHALFMWTARRLTRQWAMSIAVPLLFAGSVAAITAKQANQLAWIPDPTPARFLLAMPELFGTRPIAGLMILATAAFVVLTWRLSALKEWSWIIAFSLAPLAFWLVSQVSNIFAARYIEFTLPFYSLAVVIALRKVWVAAIFAVIIAALGSTTQLDQRAENGHADDFRAVVTDIDAKSEPGDAFIAESWLTRAGFEYYSDGSVADPLAPSGLLNAESLAVGGDRCEAADLRQYDRVWYLRINRATTNPNAVFLSDCDGQFKLTSTERVGTLVTDLYVRAGA